MRNFSLWYWNCFFEKGPQASRRPAAPKAKKIDGLTHGDGPSQNVLWVSTTPQQQQLMIGPGPNSEIEYPDSIMPTFSVFPSLKSFCYCCRALQCDHLWSSALWECGWVHGTRYWSSALRSNWVDAFNHIASHWSVSELNVGSIFIDNYECCAWFPMHKREFCEF